MNPGLAESPLLTSVCYCFLRVSFPHLAAHWALCAPGMSSQENHRRQPATAGLVVVGVGVVRAAKVVEGKTMFLVVLVDPPLGKGNFWVCMALGYQDGFL